MRYNDCCHGAEGPFELCCERGCVRGMEWTISRGLVDRDVAVDSNSKFLESVCKSGKLDAARLFHDKFRPSNARALLYDAFENACCSGDASLVEWFSDTYDVTAEYVRRNHVNGLFGANRPSSFLRTTFVADGAAVLRLACECGCLEVVEFLRKEFGLGRTDARCGDPMTGRRKPDEHVRRRKHCLSVACEGGHLALCKCLAKKFRLGLEDVAVEGFHPLLAAVGWCHFDVADWLVKRFDLKTELLKSRRSHVLAALKAKCTFDANKNAWFTRAFPNDANAAIVI